MKYICIVYICSNIYIYINIYKYSIHLIVVTSLKCSIGRAKYINIYKYNKWLD